MLYIGNCSTDTFDDYIANNDYIAKQKSSTWFLSYDKKDLKLELIKKFGSYPNIFIVECDDSIISHITYSFKLNYDVINKITLENNIQNNIENGSMYIVYINNSFFKETNKFVHIDLNYIKWIL